MKAYVTIQHDAIVATALGERETRINSKDDLDNFIVEYGVDSFACSSSLDFPGEYTKRVEIIELAQQIKGARS